MAKKSLSDPYERNVGGVGSEERPSFGGRGVVGQTKSYVSGSNTRGQYQRPKEGPEPGAKGVARSDGPGGRATGTVADNRGKPRGPGR